LVDVVFDTKTHVPFATLHVSHISFVITPSVTVISAGPVPSAQPPHTIPLDKLLGDCDEHDEQDCDDGVEQDEQDCELGDDGDWLLGD